MMNIKVSEQQINEVLENSLRARLAALEELKANKIESLKANQNLSMRELQALGAGNSKIGAAGVLKIFSNCIEDEKDVAKIEEMQNRIRQIG